MKIVYMGTPEFAVKALEKIIEAGHEVLAVITQPDKPKGRSKALVPTPVKECAAGHGIPVYQPEKINRDDELITMLENMNLDVVVVAAYGQILSERVLKVAKHGCINIHASLLPKYRGAAPIERSIIDGEKVTGVTTMYMEKGLDTGDMIEKTEVPISDDDTGATLREKLAVAGGELIVSTLLAIAENRASGIKQRDEDSTYAGMLNKEMGRIDFDSSAVVIERLIRGLNPWPCAYTLIDGKNVKLYRARVRKIDENTKREMSEKSPNKLLFLPGEIIEITKKSFTVMCKEDALTILELQPEGKKLMAAAAFLNGNKLETGIRLGMDS